MAKITAADVIVTLNLEDIDRSPDGRVGIRTFPTVAFGNTILEYSDLGIPMPAIGKFGFHFAIKRAYIEQPADGYIYSFDRANHKLRIFLGAAQSAVTLGAATQTGNVAATPAVTAGTPAGNVASNALTLDPHSHGLEIASNSAGDPVAADAALYGNATGPRLQANRAANVLIPGGVTANGGVANVTVTGILTGKTLTMDAMATHVHGAQSFTGDSHNHVVTGGGAVAEAALAEMDSGVAPAATTLYMEMVGR
jgi:hypothetical protein